MSSTIQKTDWQKFGEAYIKSTDLFHKNVTPKLSKSRRTKEC